LPELVTSALAELLNPRYYPVRVGLIWVTGLWFLSAGPLLAQPSPATTSPEAKTTADSQKPADASSAMATGSSTSAPESTPADRGWARIEYLLWRVKQAPLPVPIVTTGDPTVGFDPKGVNTVNTAGAIGQPGTQVLLGANSVHSYPFSGLRLTLGGWLDDGQFFGVEGSAFALEHRTTNFIAASDKTGNPPLYFPIFSTTAGGERGIPIADPLRGFSGNVIVSSTLRLWSAECNGIVAPWCNPNLNFNFLAGFRYAYLKENLNNDNTTTDLIFGNVTSLHDAFETSNQFYGGQIGSRLSIQRHGLSLDITGKLALGFTHQVVDIQGAITQAGPNAPTPPGLGTFPGGFFAQPTNIGSRDANHFGILPSLEVRLGYELNQRIRLFVGYDLMYWSQVVRPGDQISHQVNLSQNAVLDPNGAGVLVGPAQPAPLFNRSGFWAQGIDVGVEFRF
jgi:hypothetical protein